MSMQIPSKSSCYDSAEMWLYHGQNITSEVDLVGQTRAYGQAGGVPRGKPGSIIKAAQNLTSQAT